MGGGLFAGFDCDAFVYEFDAPALYSQRVDARLEGYSFGFIAHSLSWNIPVAVCAYGQWDGFTICQFDQARGYFLSGASSPFPGVV